MNKAELIMKVSERANVTQKVAKVIVDTLFNGMKESLERVNGSRFEALEVLWSGTMVDTRDEIRRPGRLSPSFQRSSLFSRWGKN